MSRESIVSSVNIGVPERRAATHYGRREEERKALAEYTDEQGNHVMETTFTYDELAGFVVGDELYNYIPAGAQITAARLTVTVPFLGGTSLAVGTYNVTTGAAVDADGLITDANAPLASLGAGGIVVGTGAQLNAATQLAANLAVAVTATGTFTAGEATLRISYLQKVDRFNPGNG